MGSPVEDPRRVGKPSVTGEEDPVHSGPVSGERTQVRDHIVSALYADLVGPFEGAAAHLTSRELLRRRPSTWYLTGFLVPEGNQESVDDGDELGVGDDVPADDAGTEEQEPKQRKTFPTSMGFSVLLPPAGQIDAVDVTISFARYESERIKDEGEKGPGRVHWRRVLRLTTPPRSALTPFHSPHQIPGPPSPGSKVSEPVFRRPAHDS